MNYRCKHTVEAMRWSDTDENRELFYTWFDRHDEVFETRGPIVCLPAGDHNHVAPGEWIVWMDGEFVAYGHDEFVDTYEAAGDPNALDEMLASLEEKADAVTPASPQEFSQSLVDALCSGDE